ncbi:type IV secretory system conjugative DNA transfer family protein [Acidithiobacillus thiooxidans]|uniref:type IV secretory system conjugative DNA transfer family protein n=1 Tax=Acidithiobacillus thiooxidans TaxID=930 RepID=UPI001C06C96E|nr:type IV secretory system conjugative DNA transfer family protein [Acidithiobacillus thiooxidans]MBU2839822.1 type IV secretory system conjugative DNA transfer family protein [Acidithiobacillus thiooxidans]
MSLLSGRKQPTPALHRPNQKVLDYKTQRLARGGSLKTIIGGLAAASVGIILGTAYVAREMFPHYPGYGIYYYLDAGFLKNMHAWWFQVHGWRIYNPLKFIRPLFLLHDNNERMKLIEWMFGPGMVMGLVTGTVLGFKHKDAKQDVMENQVHGSAHWASAKEVADMALLPPPGDKKSVIAATALPGDPDEITANTPASWIKFDSKHICYVGAYVEKGKPTYLQHTGAEHIIAFAPTRSGKGVGLVLPTLLDGWMDSAVVHDIKGENYLLTAGYRRQQGHQILKFNPGDPSPDGCHFNPLDAVRIGTDFEVKDTMNIATMIVDPDGKGLNDHWQKTGFALLTSVILHILYALPDKTLRGVAAFLNDPTLNSVDEAFERMLTTEHDPSGRFGWKDLMGKPTKVHQAIAQSAKEMINKADNEKSGVISTMMSFLSIYRDPIIAKWTEKSDFNIIDLQDADTPVSLYLVTSPEDKNRLKPLIRLVLNLVASQFTSADRLVSEAGRMVCKGKHRLLMLLDEFPSLGKMDIFQDSIAFLAGYNVKLYLITQDMAQLEDEGHGYGKSGAKAIVGNCHIRVAYAPNQIETAEWLSKMLGTTTITLENDNQTYDAGMLGTNKGYSTSINYQSRALLTGDEVMRLRGPLKEGSNIKEPGDLLVFVAGFAPVYGQQMLYFKLPQLLKRAQVTCPATSDKLQDGKDYKKVFPDHGGILQAPQPPPMEDDDPLAETEDTKPKTVASTEPIEKPMDDDEISALEGMVNQATDEDGDASGGKYDTSERDTDRKQIGGLMG